jgi:hypothetical protein
MKFPKSRPSIRTVLMKVRASLERAGFVREGRILRRQGLGLLQIIDAGTAAGSLTLTLGVYLPEIAAADEGRVDDSPAFGHLNFSLADFASPEGPSVGGSHLIVFEDPSDVGRVISLLESKALPFLEKLSSRSWLLQNLWRHTVSLELARVRQDAMRADTSAGLNFGLDQKALRFRPTPLVYPTPRHICEAAILNASGDSKTATRILAEGYAEALKYHRPHSQHILVVASRLGIEVASAAQPGIAADGTSTRR